MQVAHDELADQGLLVGANGTLDVDCSYIRSTCLDCVTIRDCVTPGYGLWWDGEQLAVAHDELAGNGLMLGAPCLLDVDTTPAGSTPSRR